jgi:membrane protein YdbS with pleckstrin-like domain
MKTFKSKIDTWLLVVVLISTAITLVALVVAGSYSDEPSSAMILVIMILAVAPLAWLFTSTKYIVDDESLRIQCGPFRWSIPVKDISSIRETRNPISSPALSLDRLELRHEGQKSILVSPKEKAAFRKAIGHPET